MLMRPHQHAPAGARAAWGLLVAGPGPRALAPVETAYPELCFVSSTAASRAPHATFRNVCAGEAAAPPRSNRQGGSASRIEELGVLVLRGIAVDIEHQVLVSQVRRLKRGARVHVNETTGNDVLSLGRVT